jgi:hypothetical protein
MTFEDEDRADRGFCIPMDARIATHVHRELKCKHVALSILWDEYIVAILLTLPVWILKLSQQAAGVPQIAMAHRAV